jgi:hypothetical protein
MKISLLSINEPAAELVGMKIYTVNQKGLIKGS